MPVPTQTEMFSHVLSYMVTNPTEFTRAEIREKVAAQLGISNEEKRILTSSGVPVYQSRISWAVSHLNEAGLIDRIKRGVYLINEEGKDTYSKNMTSEELSSYLRTQRVGETQENPFQLVEKEASPIELIDENVAEINAKVRRDLLARILDKDPQFFEQLTVELIERIGYGKGERTQYVADSGIDGIIATDSLGFDPILIQAKRYDPGATVGRPEVQSFAGAMNEVTRGVFITTSKFSREAVLFAKNYKHATIKLVDGDELTKLMLRFNLGVTNESVIEIKRLDVDYFEEE